MIALQAEAQPVVAPGGEIVVSGQGAAAGEPVLLRRLPGGERVASAAADGAGRFVIRARARARVKGYQLRAETVSGAASAVLSVRSRDLVLDAVGDINLGDGPAQVMGARGFAYPWTSVGPVLRRADIAFGNLECAVANRGSAVPKAFNFRGNPRSLRVAHRVAGLDVLNLANNHAGDYGNGALLDTLQNVRRYGMTPVGAGSSPAAAAAPSVISRLGLRVAFVGFSDIGPASFFATPGRAGTRQATEENIRSGVRAAAKQADVVIATFHWGVELRTHPNGRQRGFAAAARAAGADVVIGGHPHVLQPIVRKGRRLTAYSMGNFVFGAAKLATTRTGILELKLSGRGVEGARLRPARIAGVRPVLR